MNGRISETYAKDSKATLVTSLSDPYVKAIRWASDRIGAEGVVAFVTNNSFIEQIAFDGMRKHLERDFDSIYILNLGGNVRKNPKLSGTTHNVFGIQVGVSINLFIRRNQRSKAASIHYAQVDEYWNRQQKYHYLEDKERLTNIQWQEIIPDTDNIWLTEGLKNEFRSFVSIGNKEAKLSKDRRAKVLFREFSNGVMTGRDSVVYDFHEDALRHRIKSFCDDYNTELLRYHQTANPSDLDDFLRTNKIKWSRNLKRNLVSNKLLNFSKLSFRECFYRPFTKKSIYFAETIIDELGKNALFVPNPKSEKENRIVCVSGVGFRSPFSTLVVSRIVDWHFCATTDSFQCFPFYTYDENGLNRRENITDWVLKEFRSHYKDDAISKWDIFHYVYAVLHHPVYRTRYAANLKRELPRIPYAPDFHTFAQAGERLASLHVDYEQQRGYPLEIIESTEAPLDWRVEKVRLSKDKTRIVYNDFLMLAGIPAEAFEYRLGNRSALDWVIDQYQVSTDKRSGITNDPNRADDPQYIVRLIGQVITVSLETVKIVRALPDLGIKQVDTNSGSG